MVTVTLIGERQAKVGTCFVYKGFVPDCRECKLKAVCFNLDSGATYRVKAVRDVRHECRMHEEAVRVVEVEKVRNVVGLSRKSALEGSTITFEEARCRNLGCAKYRLCHPIGVERGTKYRVVEVRGDVECPEGRRLVEALIE